MTPFERAAERWGEVAIVDGPTGARREAVREPFIQLGSATEVDGAAYSRSGTQVWFNMFDLPPNLPPLNPAS